TPKTLGSTCYARCRCCIGVGTECNPLTILGNGYTDRNRGLYGCFPVVGIYRQQFADIPTTCRHLVQEIGNTPYRGAEAKRRLEFPALNESVVCLCTGTYRFRSEERR